MYLEVVIRFFITLTCVVDSNVSLSVRLVSILLNDPIASFVCDINIYINTEHRCRQQNDEDEEYKNKNTFICTFRTQNKINSDHLQVQGSIPEYRQHF